jgi:hypothetical protein
LSNTSELDKIDSCLEPPITLSLNSKAETKTEAKLEAIEAILLMRYGEIDEELSALVPKLIKLDSREYTRLLLNLS